METGKTGNSRWCADWLRHCGLAALRRSGVISDD
jgi:hypothetical protein